MLENITSKYFMLTKGYIGNKMHPISIKMDAKLLTSSKRTKDSEVDSARMA
jgi:hypothetical protein